MVLVIALGAPAALASAEIPSPILAVSGLPTVHRSETAVTIRWNTGSGVPGAVFLQSPGQPAAYQIEYGNSGDAPYPGVKYHGRYVFQLWTIGLHHTLLAENTIAGGRARFHLVARSWIPPGTSAAVNRLLQLTPFVILGLLVALTVAYLRSLRDASA